MNRQDDFRDSAFAILNALARLYNLESSCNILGNFTLAEKLADIHRDIEDAQVNMVVMYNTLYDYKDKNVQEVEELADDIHNGVYRLEPDEMDESEQLEGHPGHPNGYGSST